MILEGCTMQGTMHKQYGVANQDAYLCRKIGNDVCGIVCDGVSLKSDRTFSESEMASRLVSLSIFDYLQEHLKKNISDREILYTLFDSFDFAERMLQEMLKEAGISLFDCQTTALAFIYRKGKLYVGMAGDGGLIYQTHDGEFGVFQTRIKESPSVEPISDRHAWRFAMAGTSANPVAKVILATDGVFDSICVPTAEGLALNETLISRLFSLSRVPRNAREADLQKITEDISSHDDKTIVVMIDGRKSPMGDLKNSNSENS